MLKLLGGVLLAGGAAAMGYSASAWLARRVRTLRAMLGALELMEREERVIEVLSDIPRPQEERGMEEEAPLEMEWSGGGCTDG